MLNLKKTTTEWSNNIVVNTCSLGTTHSPSYQLHHYKVPAKKKVLTALKRAEGLDLSTMLHSAFDQVGSVYDILRLEHVQSKKDDN